MHELTFFRQKRFDNGVRTGVEWDGMTLLGRFDESRDEADRENPLGSALLWFVDIISTLQAESMTPVEARRWHQERHVPIRDGLLSLSDLLKAGVDDDWPLRWQVPPDSTGGVDIRIQCSFIKRVTPREIRDVLREIAGEWAVLLDGLEVPPVLALN